MKQDNSDLRKQAVQAIANYMHHEMFEVSGHKAGEMLPWMSQQGSKIMGIIDRAIVDVRLKSKEMKAKGLL